MCYGFPGAKTFWDLGSSLFLSVKLADELHKLIKRNVLDGVKL